MKKLFTLLVACAFMFAVTACDSTPKTEDSVETFEATEESVEDYEETPEMMEDSVVTDTTATILDSPEVETETEVVN